MKREEKKAQTRQKIADSAIELFEMQGFETTTVQQITERAEVAKGTFFNYYDSKEDLILELQGMVVMRQIENVFGKPGPIIPRLQAILFEYARQFTMSRSVTRAVLQGIFGSTKLREAQVNRCDELHVSLIPIFESAQQKGEIRADMPAATIAQLAVQTYFGTLMSWAIDQGEPEFADQIALAFEVFIQGISP
jgi:AcrR family transcriptional regulator